MWCLQPAHPRLVRRVRILEVINRVVGGHRRRRGNELIGHPTQLRDILSREDVGDDDEAIAIIGGALSVSEHKFLPQGRPPCQGAVWKQHCPGWSKAFCNPRMRARYVAV